MTSGHPIAIQPRKMTFDFNQLTKRDWFGGNPIISAYLSTLSATFPPGEQEFIASVRAYQNEIKDKHLRESVRGFVGQEAHHSKHHHQLNQRLDEIGLHATRLERHLARHIRKQRARYPDNILLAATVGMEHVTAVLANHILNNPEILEPAPQVIQALLHWHAIEEIEHKAVAFEVYQQCVGDEKLLHRVMRLQTMEFILRTTAYTWAILYWNRTTPTLGQIREAHRFFWGKNGFYRQNFPEWRAYFQAGFHPWNTDNRSLVESWKRRMALI